MLKKPVTYENFDGEEVTEVLYFHISKTELIKLEARYGEAGFRGVLQSLIDTKDGAKLVEILDEIIMLAYGQRSEDGNRFYKTEKVQEEFRASPAYDALFFEIATDDQAATEFIMGILPNEVAAEVEKQTPKLDPPSGAPQSVHES